MEYAERRPISNNAGATGGRYKAGATSRAAPLAGSGGRGHGPTMLSQRLYTRSAASLCACAALLSACGGGVRTQGSAAIARFLATVHSGDRKAFEALIDRPAVRSDLTEQMADVAKRHEVDVGEGPSEFAVDRMITLQAVRLTAARVAPVWPATPTAIQIAPHMKARDSRHICLEEAATKRCLLSFARKDGAWRLTGMMFTPPPAETETAAFRTTGPATEAASSEPP